LIEAYAEEKDIDLNGYGNATFRREAVARGAEPDECYCLGKLREVPDLVIEIALSSGGINKLDVYRGLEVPEVWFWENNKFSIHVLKDNKYQKINGSSLLPDLDLSLLISYVGQSSQTQAVKAYRKALQNY
jgi:Uma2 family endonuclease